jgi:carbamoyl-phosphate synthase large subunit
LRTILITGVGAIIGYGVVRSLSRLGEPLTLIGADIYKDAVGQAWVDHFEQAPLTGDGDYFDWLVGILKRHKVDLVIPCIEQDVHFFAANESRLETLDAKFAVNRASLVDLTRDKWAAYQELKRIGSPCAIDSYIEGGFARLKEVLGLPFLVKPRESYASKGIVRVHREEDFIPVADKLSRTHIAQPIVGEDGEEYTVGVFGDGLGGVSAVIALRRRLAIDGSTVKAWTCEPESLIDCVKSLSAHFKPIGPTNFQFRLDVGSGAWKLLEINPRISSSTSLRTAFGYNEAEMCVRFYLDKEVIRQPVIRHGRAARYIEDMVIYDSNNR